MSDIAIRVENLGKRYKIGRLQKRNDTLRDSISDFGFSIFDLKKRFNGHNQKSEITNQKSDDTLWALRDVSFEVKRGEVVGIIGRNGAGKSTLLKILSRITEPTTGAVDIYGRVGSLLEVGTGFHPELTGRENIFLNGAILGMRKSEIGKKFDEIVAFAEVEKFIDTPVKRYSSGMYVRLAFAVAAHLEPEILLVDEVLAVGDAAFQKKCLGKMGDVAREGRTVLFVSHNMAMVENLCRSAMWLEHGKTAISSDTRSVIDKYLESSSAPPEAIELSSADLDLVINILDRDGIPSPSAKSGDPLFFNLHIVPKRQLSQMDLTLVVFNLHGQRILTFDTRYQVKEKFNVVNPCKYIIRWDKNILRAGRYVIGVGVYESGRYLTGWESASQLDILESDYYGTGKLPDSGQGHILTDVTWLVQDYDRLINLSTA